MKTLSFRSIVTIQTFIPPNVPPSTFPALLFEMYPYKGLRGRKPQRSAGRNPCVRLGACMDECINQRRVRVVWIYVGRLVFLYERYKMYRYEYLYECVYVYMPAIPV